MVQQYGTLEAQTEQVVAPAKSSVSKYVVAFVAVALVTIGVVAVSTTVTSTGVNSVVDANRNRAVTAKIDPEVRELGIKVLNMTVNGLRWAIFGFNVQKTEIIPLTAGPATADWDKDFKMMTNALPEMDAAVAVYNFEYWADSESTGVEPLMITWAPHGIDPRDEARAGYYLPGIILALNTDEGRINTERIDTGANNDNIGKTQKGHEPYEHGGFSGPYRLDSISDTYRQFCHIEMGLSEKECSLENSFHNCPFESEDEAEWTDSNPCKQKVCEGDSFQPAEDAEAGTISQACCDYIEKEFCTDPEHYGTMGCHEVTLTAIDKLCEIPQPAEPVIVEFHWAQEVRCAPQCADSCKTFEDPNDTWRMCEGCHIDLMPDDDAENKGQISQCYPGALGYEMNTCCGNELTQDGEFFCEQAENLSYEVCNMLEYYDCKWLPQKECPEEKRAQDIADAPTGCCYMLNPDEGENLFHTTASFNFNEDTEAWDFASGVLDEQIPSVLCGGGKYADPDDTSVFAEGQECSEVKAGFEAELVAYEEAQAALAAAATTAAPERRR